MCDNCKRKYGVKTNSCDEALSIAAERYLRLRSDEWLQKAAEEIKSHRWTSPLDGDDKPLDVLAILRKHRDGA